MRIVHLVIGGEIAGGQTVALQLARAARASGHEVAFIAPAVGSFTELAEGEGFRVHVLPFSGALDVRALLRLRRLLAATRADVLHTHVHFSGNVLGRLGGRLAGAAVIAHMHIENVFRSDGLGRAAQVALDDLTARLCPHIVAVSEATRESLLRQGYPARVVTVHNGIDVGAPAAPVRVVEGPTILHVGRLCDVKGQRELIRALAELDAFVVLVGRDLEAGGAFQQRLEREAERLGVSDRVLFVGYRDDVPGLLAGCDVFCLPSWIEGLPVTVLEAMAQARPVVASAVGGTPEVLVDGETGLLVPPRNLQALAGALGRLLDDPELARRLGEAGRARVEERFSERAMTERVLALYAEVAR